MAFSVISISLDSSEEIMGTSTTRVIFFGMIPTTVPATTPTADLPVIHDDNPLIPTDTPTISPIVPIIPPIAPTIQYTSPFVYTDSSDNDTPDTPPSHDSYEAIILHAPPGLPHRPAVLVLPGLPIPVDSSSETSSDSHSDTSSDSSSRHSSSDHPISDSLCDSPIATSVGPYRKRRRSPTTSVLVASPVPEALSFVHADLLPPCKRIRYSNSETDFEVDIDACTAFADDIAAKGMNVRVEDGTAAKEEAESSARGTIEIGVDRVTHLVVSDDTVEPVREDFPELVSADGSLEVMQRGLDVVMQDLYEHMVEIPVHKVRIIESVQRDKGHRIVATSQQSATMSERIDTLDRDNMRLRGMLGVERTMPTATCSGMTQDAINELIAKRVEEALQAYDAAKNPGTETEMENEQQDDNIEVNGNNGNGNGNGNPNVNNRGVVPVTREFTYQDFVKCLSLNFKGIEKKFGLTCWFEKTGDGIPYQTVGVDATYAIMWKALMKLMTKVYCPRNEIQKMERELWNLTMVLEEEDQDAIYIANNLMDQKLKGYAIKNAENKRRFDNNSRDNRGQQQKPFKRQNINGKNVVRAYTVGNNVERKGYAKAFPYYNKCRMHHEGPCMVKCGNCKRVGHMTRDFKAAVAATAQRALVGNQTSITCYECRRQGHYRSECPKLRTQNRKNKIGNKTGNNEVKVIAYAIGGGGANPNSNVVTDISYVVELADGRISETNMILRGCTLGLLGHPFNIDLMPIELGGFDVIIGMDWLAKYHVVIVCDEKIVRIPYGDAVLIIKGDGCNGGSKSKLSIISCTKTRKYIQKGCQVYLAQVTSKKTNDKSEEKRLEDVPIDGIFWKSFEKTFLDYHLVDKLNSKLT
ncbi:putative reverse transcriptase domain-containing protein [Tanacetum coccineum]